MPDRVVFILFGRNAEFLRKSLGGLGASSAPYTRFCASPGQRQFRQIGTFGTGRSASLDRSPYASKTVRQ